MSTPRPTLPATANDKSSASKSSAAPAAVGSKSKSKARKVKPGHKRTIAEDLTLDKQTPIMDVKAEVAKILEALIPRSPSQSALQMIGFGLSVQIAGDLTLVRKWVFWDLFAGTARISASLRAMADLTSLPTSLGATWAMGPVVDIARPDVRCDVMLRPPSFQARRTDAEWKELRERAERLWNFSIHVCQHQLSQGRAASLENPPGSYAWQLQRSQQVLGLGAEKMTIYGTSSCSWGMVDPVSGRPYRKPQRFACSESLASLKRKCQCKQQGKKHQTASGHARGHGR
ncbi:unnamed protein product, partial [Symbiodinium necroappetens]